MPVYFALRSPRVFPARAGLNRPQIQPVERGRRIPRTRGAEPNLLDFEITDEVYSPHARG